MENLSKDDVLHLGLKFVSHKSHRQTQKSLVKKFVGYFGAEPKILVKQWKDLFDTIPNKEQNERGLRMFMMCHYFLFCYPRNAQVLAKDFGMCDKNSVSGKKLWTWLERIAALKEKKIVWPHERFRQEDYAKFVMTVDCVDCHTREPKHPRYNLDNAYSSHKFKKAGFRYELALEIQFSNLIWINGPYKAGSDSDIKIFKEGGLRAKMRALPGKKGIADQGYEGESALLAMPTTIDKHHVHTFKSRARCRMENFNARIKQYHSMNTYWEHGKAKHKIAFEAVCVTCQYRMENGHPLWDV